MVEFRKLRILHLFTHSAPTRGGAVQGLLLAGMQHHHGHNVISIFHKDKTFDTKHYGFRIFFKNMKNPVSYVWLSTFIARTRPHVIHCHRNLALLYGFFSARWLRTDSWNPVLVINRGTTYNLPNQIVRFVFHSDGLDHIIAVSEAVKKKLILDERIPPDKITVIYGSYDDSRFKPDIDGINFRKEFGLGLNIPVVTCVAAVDKRKGIEYLIEAASIIVQDKPDVRFFVVGAIEDRDYYNILKMMVCKYKLETSFYFVGHRDDIPSILAASSVSVSASVEGEGITGALRESLAMKKPVVATDVSGNYEIIKNGITGWMVPPRNPEALAKAILDVLDRKDEALKRAENGYRLIKKLCSPEERYRKVEELYEKLINARRLI